LIFSPLQRFMGIPELRQRAKRQSGVKK